MYSCKFRSSGNSDLFTTCAEDPFFETMMVLCVLNELAGKNKVFNSNSLASTHSRHLSGMSKVLQWTAGAAITGQSENPNEPSNSLQ